MGVHVGFVVSRVALQQVFLWALWFFLTNYSTNGLTHLSPLVAQ